MNILYNIDFDTRFSRSYRLLGGPDLTETPYGYLAVVDDRDGLRDALAADYRNGAVVMTDDVLTPAIFMLAASMGIRHRRDA